uniref:CAZy families GH95 protein n=1 Tax=uncultured Flavobacterium sp. TaxID=165435 RepID=A0A060CK64_9FLAO|nr:CAZy families GH95 protein [uncultured Flavobacterium sp.]
MLCRDVQELTLFFAVRSSFNGSARHPVTQGRDPAVQLQEDVKHFEVPFEQLEQAHIRDYRQYFDRVHFSLPESGRAEWDLYDRLCQFEKDGADQALCALLFDYGRYLLISSSRPGHTAG